MGMAAILFNDAEPFEQIDTTPRTEGPVWNLVKIGHAVSEKKTFKDYEIAITRLRWSRVIIWTKTTS